MRLREEGSIEAAVRDPRALRSLPEDGWDLLIRQGRRANLLGHLAAALEDSGELANVPAQPRGHLASALALVQHQTRAVRWEARKICAALSELAIPIVALKGMAYVLAEVPNARGRMFSDIDILVPEESLALVEGALMLNGWTTLQHDAYDQRYYRTWMHELPPMRHMKRGTVIDVHHAILPRTARIHADSASMRTAAIAVAGFSNLYVFQPVDMVLHSATHLFNEGELDKGLRDLVDLDLMLRHFARTDGFWTRLERRATEVGLGGPLHYGLHHAVRLLGTPVPPATREAVASWGPSAPVGWVMDGLFARALRPNHPSADSGLTGLARWLLYVRGHWLRMPAHLLLYHLARKAIKGGDEADLASDRPKLRDNAPRR